MPQRILFLTGHLAAGRLRKVLAEMGKVDFAWETRDYDSATLLPVAEVVALARDGKPGDKPLVIADYTDNPGGGGYGDATALLSGMIEADLQGVAFHALCDPGAVSSWSKILTPAARSRHVVRL